MTKPTRLTRPKLRDYKSPKLFRSTGFAPGSTSKYALNAVSKSVAESPPLAQTRYHVGDKRPFSEAEDKNAKENKDSVGTKTNNGRREEDTSGNDCLVGLLVRSRSEPIQFNSTNIHRIHMTTLAKT